MKNFIKLPFFKTKYKECTVKNDKICILKKEALLFLVYVHAFFASIIEFHFLNIIFNCAVLLKSYFLSNKERLV